MHICLLPIEILIDIFAAIYEGSFGNKKTLAALARTCRKFKEPALNALWKDMYSFTPLIRCLPEDVRGSTSIDTLKRPLFHGEWKIFNSYACRIRSLVIHDSHLDEIDDRVVKTLVSAPSPTLLPNLHHLQWWNNQDSYLPLLQALLAPTLRSITLYSENAMRWGSNKTKPWGSSFATSALLVSLGARCPHIQTFVCSYSHNFGEHSDSLCETLCCWSELVLLKTGVLSTRALIHLASLPSLKSLHFESCGFFSGMHPNSLLTFASELDETSIGAPSLPTLIDCLRNVRFMSCRSVVLWFRDLDLALSDPLDIPDFVVSISECFSSTVEQLSVEFVGLLSISTRGLADPRFVLSVHAITPLLSFSYLKKVDLSCFCAIDDAMIKTMAQSWPLLEEFSIGGGACWLIPSLTFTGLLHLIRHCQHLCNIAMPFRTSLINSNSEPFSKTIRNAKITEIYVGYSPIDAAIAAAVACQLHLLLPNLRDVRSCLRRGHEWDPPAECERSDVQWARVNEFLKVLTDVAEMRQKQEQVLQDSLLV